MKAYVTATFDAGELARLERSMPVVHEDSWKTHKVYFSGEELTARVREVGADVLVVEADLVHEEVIGRLRAPADRRGARRSAEHRRRAGDRETDPCGVRARAKRAGGGRADDRLHAVGAPPHPRDQSSASLGRAPLRPHERVPRGLRGVHGSRARVVDGRDRRLSSLRSGAIGGAPFTPELLREIRRRFEIDVATRYSATEIAMGTGSRPGDPEEMVAETVGRAASEIEIAVVDEAGRRLPAGEVGEVAVCSPPRWSAIGTGPRRRRRCSIARAGSTRATSASSTSAATSACAAGGRRCTSAAVTTCTRRGRSMARSPSPDRAGRGGRSSRSGARREGARGRRAEDRDAPPSAEEIRDYCRSSLADYKAPDFVVIASELPTNTTYKVDKAAIRERFASSRTARDE